MEGNSDKEQKGGKRTDEVRELKKEDRQEAEFETFDTRSKKGEMERIEAIEENDIKVASWGKTDQQDARGGKEKQVARGGN